MSAIRRGLHVASNRRLLAALLCAFLTAGCVPVLSLAAAALGGRGEPSVVAAPSPFDGAPSSSQNRDPSNPVISEALSAAEQQEVTAECKAKLPPPEPPPAIGCEVRPACLPGARTPMRLRLCARNPETAQPLPPEAKRSAWAWELSQDVGPPAGP